MATWISISLIATLIKLTNGQNCTKGTSILKGAQITCTNVTADFFQTSKLILHRSHWLTCENCDISFIDEDTFNVDKRNNISYLFLYQNNVKVLKNFAFGTFPLLKVLSLRDNILDNLYIKCFFGIKRLTQLDLSNNLLGVLPNNIFQELENLDLLNLDHNEISAIEHDAFLGLINLKHLYINYNNLEELTENLFQHLVSLKILYIQNNKLLKIHPLAFVNLRQLNYLYLNNNSISYLVQYNFKPLASLIDLQMRNNNLEEIQTSSFNGLKNIKYLHLGRNKISRVKPYGFIGLNSLQHLELIGNEFEYFSMDYFKNMESLSVLWLQNNRIDNFSVSYNSDVQSSLSVLGLSNNNLTFLNYKLLYNKIPHLTELFIYGNRWNCQFVVDMYTFFYNRSVLLCASYNCSMDDTEVLIEEACKNYYLNVTETVDYGEDFVLDCTNLLQYNLYILLLAFALALYQR